MPGRGLLEILIFVQFFKHQLKSKRVENNYSEHAETSTDNSWQQKRGNVVSLTTSHSNLRLTELWNLLCLFVVGVSTLYTQNRNRTVANRRNMRDASVPPCHSLHCPFPSIYTSLVPVYPLCQLFGSTRHYTLLYYISSLAKMILSNYVPMQTLRPLLKDGISY